MSRPIGLILNQKIDYRLVALDIISSPARNYSIYTFALFSLFSSLAAFAKAILYARILGADAFSIFSAVELIAAYGIYAGSLGIIDAAAKLVPIYCGANRLDQAQRTIALAIGGLLLTSGFVLIIYLIFTVVLQGGSEFLWAFVLAGVYAFFNNIFSLGIAYILGIGDRNRFSSLMATKAIVSLAFGYFISVLYGLIGIIVLEILSSIFFCIYLFIGKGKLPKLRLPNLHQTAHLAKEGLPLLANNLIQNISRNSERVIIAIGLGTSALGQFSFALIVVTSGIALQNFFSQYFNPIVLFIHGSRTDVKEIKSKIDYSILVTTGILLLLYPIFLALINYFSIHFYSDFREGLDISSILYFSAILHLGQIYQIFFIAEGKAWKLTGYSFSVGLFSITLSIIGLLYDMSGSYFAFVFVLNRALNFCLLRFF